MPYIESNGKRILFIHIPRTGGTSIERWMGSVAPLRLLSVGLPSVLRCTPQHFRMQDLRVLFGEGYFDYAFAIARDPYARIASEYRMRAIVGQGSFWNARASFSLWLEDNLARQAGDPFHLDNHLRPQWEFIGTNVEVFRFEQGVMSPLCAVEEKLGLPAPVAAPHELRTQTSNIPVNWDLADRLRVQEHYSRDFALFHYTP